VRVPCVVLACFTCNRPSLPCHAPNWSPCLHANVTRLLNSFRGTHSWSYVHAVFAQKSAFQDCSVSACGLRSRALEAFIIAGSGSCAVCQVRRRCNNFFIDVHNRCFSQTLRAFFYCRCWSFQAFGFRSTQLGRQSLKASPDFTFRSCSARRSRLVDDTRVRVDFLGFAQMA